jgi:hypothetical protein
LTFPGYKMIEQNIKVNKGLGCVIIRLVTVAGLYAKHNGDTSELSMPAGTHGTFVLVLNRL